MDVSAIKGDVFPDENARLAYLDHSLQSVLRLVGNVSDAEYVDVALIALRLVTNFQVCNIRTHTLVPSRAHARTHTPTHTHTLTYMRTLIFEGNDWGSMWCLLYELLWCAVRLVTQGTSRTVGMYATNCRVVSYELLGSMPRTVGIYATNCRHVCHKLSPCMPQTVGVYATNGRLQ